MEDDNMIRNIQTTATDHHGISKSSTPSGHTSGDPPEVFDVFNVALLAPTNCVNYKNAEDQFHGAQISKEVAAKGVAQGSPHVAVHGFPDLSLPVPTDPVSFDDSKVARSAQISKQVAAQGVAQEGSHGNRNKNVYSKDRGHINKCSSNPKLLELSGVNTGVSTSTSVNSDITRLPLGTGVYYTPRRSINSKGYGKVCSIEALSHLADVSCKLQRHQRSCKLSAKRSESTTFKEHYSHHRSKKLIPTTSENIYKIVKKMRTPRRKTLQQRSSNLQEHSLSKRDEPFAKNATSGSNLIFSQFLRDHQPNHVYHTMNDASTTTFFNKEISSSGARRSSSDTALTTTELALPAQSATNNVRSAKPPSRVHDEKKEQSKGNRAQRYARKILQFVGDTSISEKLVREALGNNPDTSKALRLLVAERKLKRLGDGGKGKAYVYVATMKGLLELQELQQAGELALSTPDSESASSIPTTARMPVTNQPLQV